jgi:hypothetical protein
LLQSEYLIPQQFVCFFDVWLFETRRLPGFLMLAAKLGPWLCGLGEVEYEGK